MLPLGGREPSRIVEFHTLLDVHAVDAPSFAARPMGAYVDPDKMIAARKAGASPWELHERAFSGEFAPAQPYDPRALL